MHHNAEKLQEILNRIMQGIIITSAQLKSDIIHIIAIPQLHMYIMESYR